MSKNFGMFLLFSVLVTGLVINTSSPLTSGDSNSSFDLVSHAFAQSSNATGTNGTSSNSTSTLNLDESMNLGDDANTPKDDMMDTEDDMSSSVSIMMVTVLSPLKQVKTGTLSGDVICNQGLELAFKLNGQSAYVKPTSVQKLITRGWTQ